MKKSIVSRPHKKTPLQTVAIIADRFLRAFVCDLFWPSLRLIVHLCGLTLKLSRWVLLAALAVCALPFAVAAVVCLVACGIIALPFFAIVK